MQALHDTQGAYVYRTLVLTCATGLLAGCADAASDEVEFETVTLGDTIVVTSRGDGRTGRIDGVQVLWQSEELDRPNILGVVGEHLVIADRTSLHVLTRAGAHLRTIGRDGSGPGEFGQIAQLGGTADTIVSYDAMLGRLTFFSLDGTHLRDVRVTPRVPFVNPVRGTALAVSGRDIFSLWSGFPERDLPTRTALVRHDLTTDSIHVVQAWDGSKWLRLGEFIIQDPLFGPQTIAAITHPAGMAVGDGIQYCITVRPFASGTNRKSCRVRTPVRLGPGIRDPDLSVAPAERRAALGDLIGQQRVADHLPFFDLVLLETNNRLWVRTIGAESANIHPYLRPYLAPVPSTHRAWDLFDIDGRFVGSVDVPATFRPQAIVEGQIYGFLELETGEIAIGVAGVPF